MGNQKARAIASVLIVVLALVLIVTGVVGMSRRATATGEEILTNMRTRAVLIATGEGAVESYVAIAADQAREAAQAAGASMSEIREAVAAAEEEARNNSSANLLDYATADTTGLDAALSTLRAALMDYRAEEAAAEAAYVEQMQATAAPEETEVDTSQLTSEADLEAMLAEEEEVEVDMSGFVATERMNELRAIADEKYAGVCTELMALYDTLDQAALDTLEGTIFDIVSQSGDDFAREYDRYNAAGGAAALSNRFGAWVIRYGDDLVYVGVGLILAALVVFFYPTLVKKLGVPRMIIGLFFVLLCVVALIYDLSLSGLMSNTLVRMGMNSILVLAMAPGIQCGIGLNLGLPIGIVGGLIGGLLAIEWQIGGWLGFVFACLVGMAISAVSGALYGMLLNRLKGSEMSVTTYVGFSIVSLMCIAWLVLPFNSLELRWPLGTGLRNTIVMSDATSFGHILDNFLSFSIGGFTVPTGLLLFMALCCYLVWLFMRSRTGVAMMAVGNNRRFAEATGVNVDRMRIIGTMISTMLGAVGILVYSQSYGFMQLYTAPRQMGFVAASAILIGGATTSRCKISHVLIGTFLFQGVLTLGMPVANALVPQSTISETMRILISNGIILYALTKSGGEQRA